MPLTPHTVRHEGHTFVYTDCNGMRRAATPRTQYRAGLWSLELQTGRINPPPPHTLTMDFPLLVFQGIPSM